MEWWDLRGAEGYIYIGEDIVFACTPPCTSPISLCKAGTTIDLQPFTQAS